MKRIVETFITLVKIDSPTGYETGMANFLVNYFTKRNLRVEKDAFHNVFVKVPGMGKPIFLSAHMDTVEPGKGITPQIKNGNIISDGTTIVGADNKSTIAVFLELLERLREEKISHRPIELLFTVKEEAGTFGAKQFDFTKLEATEGIISDVSIPVGQIITSSPAYLGFDIDITGKAHHASHAAFDEKAHNLFLVLHTVLSQIPVGKLDEQTICNIGVIQAGTVRNTIPGNAKLHGEIRSFDKTLIMKYFKNILAICKKTCQTYNLKLENTYTMENDAYVFSEDDLFLQKIAKVFSVQHIKSTYMKRWSCSDANIFNTKGLQVVNIGDGTEKTHSW